MENTNWSYPTEIRFGIGRSDEIVEACSLHGIKNPLFVTDRGLLSLKTTVEVLNKIKLKLPVTVFSDVDSNPTEVNLEAGIKVFIDGDHDGVIAFGGGSAIDLGKLIAFMAVQSIAVWEFEDISDWWKKANSSGIKPIIAIPTTAGTGSEVGRAAVLTNSLLKKKKIIFHPKILPSLVICDPSLTVTMPKFLTAGTGLDAFAHCLEAYCSPFYHPMSNGIALEGIKLIKDNLSRAYNVSTDIVARSNMMAAALMGAVAFQKGLGAIHALSHPIGALYNTHHGMTNAVLMPFVLEFNKCQIRTKIENLANYLRIEDGFDGFMLYINRLAKELEIPVTLSGLGIDQLDYNSIIEGALSDPSRFGNPRKLNSENLRHLLGIAQ